MGHAVTHTLSASLCVPEHTAMQGRTFNPVQRQPLHDLDRKIVDRLLQGDGSQKQDILDAARLFIRYDGANGSADIQHDLINVLQKWGMSRDELNLAARLIWTSNWRPDRDSDDEVTVGSGADPQV